ncbi:MAG: ABC transporter permease/substrate-binding protein [Streptococcaceae bacterium]|jgi:osmoprotectant transport system permease protein|nr:ABC transporter permease/substrate-binding protein [Streptococcaceae bacterium]
MTNFLQTLSQQRGNLWTYTLQHIQISLISLFIAILIAIPLALLLRRFPKAAEAALQITGIFQTIPSLALLGLMIPIIGVGTVPAVVALVIYAIFPILQTSYTGLSQIDPSLDEAGTAFGMTRREKLMKYELPIAMPFVMAGIRTATVMIVGTATLAALIAAGGLGNFIMLGINTSDASLILIGAISSALLAVIFSFILSRLQKAKIRTILISFAVALVVLLGSFYRPAAGNHPTLTIGGKLGSEPNLIINMYKDLIEADSDIRVNLKENFGDTTFCYNALNSGKIDIYPEYTGTITTTFMKQPTHSTDPATVYSEAEAGMAKKGLAYLSPMAFQDTFALAVKSDYAKQNHLTTISDLSNLTGTPTAGFDLEFANRSDGYKGLESKYGLKFDVKTMQTSLIYNALESNAVQIAEVYSTDSQIKQYHLVVLKDDKELFPPYQAAPLMKASTLKKYPELKSILDKLAGRITESQMQEMNYEVAVQGKDPETVAETYLVSQGLLKK